MGGLGSGRHDYATTPTVDESRPLDVNKFTDVVDHPGYTGVLRWGDPDDPDATVSFGLVDKHQDTDRADALRLEYSVSGPSVDDKSHDYRVPLEYTECNFGGVRPWFRCPGVVDGDPCGRRVAKLYLPPGADLFLCRECYDLGYASSRASGDDVRTAELRYRRAYAKLDPDGRRPHPTDHGPVPPDRPTGMHHSTYQDLAADVRDAYREWDRATRRRIQAVAREYDVGPLS